MIPVQRLGSALASAAAAFAVLVAARAGADEPPIPPAPAQWVTDTASFISADERDSLNAELKGYERQTGHQIIVWIGDTTGDTALERYTIDAFTKWKVGRKGLDDGAVLFVFAKDHKVRVEVGYGLEGSLTDARSSEIIRDVIVPKIRAGDDDGAIQGGVDAMIAAIGGAPMPSPPPSASGDVLTGLGPFIGLFVFMIFLILVLRSPGYAGWMLYTLGSGRGGGWGGGGWGGGGFGGGGGFSGGGGMGGGGGASGGW